ncbi:hypothetical protein [Clostridium sp.]|uniref:hypothetical protein n=1 Tax=Clostridium sp. TaxID=1506 RepID=UPI0029118D8F|nr:hypothetical protein [Clostridium sp.]MDU3526436.1 hypothetical protein [Clostridium sp.]
MKLELKNKENYSGVYIILTIGKRKNVSYWSAPPNSIDHVCLKYLSDRYPLITTEKRMAKFKELYKELGLICS